MTDLSRRDFLKLARDGFLYLSGALAFVGFLRFLDYDPHPARKTQFDLGLAEKYPLGSRIVLDEIPAVLIHTESGFTALSLTCTHLGCTLESDVDGFACPCHNSRFDAEGKVTHGPATKPMLVLRVEITENNALTLHSNY
jgi:Rieske Fe-S protein